MNIQDFKEAFGIEKIDLVTCKDSARLSAGKVNGRSMYTTVEFDHTKPVFVYEADAEDGTQLYILSNKEPFVGELVATL